jgi:membrane-associated phospholipid phosphatase
MKKSLWAKIISVIFHPALLQFAYVVYPEGLLLQVDPWFWGGIALCVSFVPLFLSGLYLKITGHQEFFNIPQKKRLIPFLFSIAALVFAWSYLKDDFPETSRKIVHIVILNTIALLVTLKEKISLHVYGLFSLAVLWFPNLAICIVLFLPFIVYARLKLKAHSISQIIAGGVLGILCAVIIRMVPI